MTRILLVDDHAIFRSGMRALLDGTPDLEVVAEASDGVAALAMLERHEVDVMLLDLSMPGAMSGPRTAEEALESHPHLTVVVLSMHDDDYYLREMLEIGARAYVLKRSPPEVLTSAIRAAAGGQQFVDPALVGGLINAYMGRPKGEGEARLDLLTDREREVCRLVALGYTNQEVGRHLHISPRTVETHRRNVMHRLDLRNRAELVRFAIDNALIKVG